jgi:class I fructose-bisphosphate aldolase
MSTKISERVKEILSWYKTENNGVLTNLCKLLNTGTLAGTGKMVILPVDQGFEHGPVRSFGVNPPAFDPKYHFELALESGCNGYAAPYGQLAATAGDFIGEIPIIVKANNSETLYNPKSSFSAVTCSIKECLRLGATAVGFTIYPGSSERKDMYQEIVELSEEARSYGLPVILWSYARGEQVSKDGETAVDVVAYSAQIACQLGAHIVKVKPPTAHIEQDAARKQYEKAGIKIDTLSDRIRNVVNSCFGGKRIVIFSGGEAKGDAELLEEIRQINAGGGFGSIMGRNAFQRPKAEGVKILRQAMAILKEGA